MIRPGGGRVVGAVLTGGASKRFGSDKALATLDPNSPTTTRLGARPILALRDAGVDPVVAVGGSSGFELGVPVVDDRRAGLGPLSGLASVLVWAKRGHVVVLPCDLPLVRSEHLRPLLSWLATAKPDTAGIASVGGTTQPIVGVWPASAGPALAGAVRSGRRRMFDALSHVAWEAVDVDPFLVQDADTPSDLSLLLGVDPKTP